jgi:predicted MFS family arabinose efflux permease
VAIGLVFCILASILLPFIGRTEVGALTGLFFSYISFEYMVVSELPMMTELVPSRRATVLALNLFGFSLGRSLGALISTFIYERSGFPVVMLIATLFNIFALLALAEMQKKIAILPRLFALFKQTPPAD